jgi:hypothetical protein
MRGFSVQLKDIDISQSQCLLRCGLALCEVVNLLLPLGELRLGWESARKGGQHGGNGGNLHDGRHLV